MPVTSLDTSTKMHTVSVDPKSGHEVHVLRIEGSLNHRDVHAHDRKCKEEIERLLDSKLNMEVVSFGAKYSIANNEGQNFNYKLPRYLITFTFRPIDSKQQYRQGERGVDFIRPALEKREDFVLLEDQKKELKATLKKTGDLNHAWMTAIAEDQKIDFISELSANALLNTPLRNGQYRKPVSVGYSRELVQQSEYEKEGWRVIMPILWTAHSGQVPGKFIVRRALLTSADSGPDEDRKYEKFVKATLAEEVPKAKQATVEMALRAFAWDYSWSFIANDPFATAKGNYYPMATVAGWIEEVKPGTQHILVARSAGDSPIGISTDDKFDEAEGYDYLAKQTRDANACFRAVLEENPRESITTLGWKRDFAGIYADARKGQRVSALICLEKNKRELNLNQRVVFLNLIGKGGSEGQFDPRPDDKMLGEAIFKELKEGETFKSIKISNSWGQAPHFLGNRTQYQVLLIINKEAGTAAKTFVQLNNSAKSQNTEAEKQESSTMGSQRSKELNALYNKKFTFPKDWEVLE